MWNKLFTHYFGEIFKCEYVTDYGKHEDRFSFSFASEVEAKAEEKEMLKDNIDVHGHVLTYKILLDGTLVSLSEIYPEVIEEYFG